LGEAAHNKLPAPDLFAFRHWWSDNLLVLRTSPESQGGNQNGHDHDRFQKFQSKSPPFAASCSGLFRQGTTGKQCFFSIFLDVSQTGRRIYLEYPVVPALVVTVSFL
jgi:hypothetical protein